MTDHADDFPVTDEPAAADLAQLDQHLYEFNVASTGIDDGRWLAIVLRDEAGQIYAGLHGHTWGGVCEIKTIWVAGDRRKQGLGGRMLRAAEDEARRRGCRQVLLTTHSFQAPDFYKRHGYVHVATADGYPAGYTQLSMVKTLDAS